MANQVNISLNDSVPAAHTFVAQGVDAKKVAHWIEKTTEASPIGHFRLSMSTRLPTKPGEPVRTSARLVIPVIVTETINGVSSKKVARQSFVSVDFVMPADSTLAERKDTVEYIGNLLKNFTTANTLGWQVVEQEAII